MAANTKTSVGYLISTSIAENVFMGGAMVTDPYGLPLEFRYTEPVKATKLQRILYGDVLEQYIQTDVILASILDHLEQKPSLFIVNDAAFLAAAEARGKTTVWLGEGSTSPLAEVGASVAVSADEMLLQFSKTGGPMRVKFAAGAGSPAGVAGPAGTRQAEIVRMLTDLAGTMDVSEPIRRVERALKLLYEEGGDGAALASG